MTVDVPKLVQNDGWLEPYTEDILRRVNRHQSLVAEIVDEHGSLKNYANARSPPNYCSS